MTRPTILIYATAITGGGPLTILREVLRAARDEGLDPVVLVSTATAELLGEQPGVRVHAVAKGGWLWRIGWDVWRLRRWIATHAPDTTAVLGLQNTSVNVPDSITQVLYVHQPMPFDPHRFRWWRPEERRLWAYRRFYGFFITLFRSRIDHIVVQTEWMRDGVLSKLRMRPKQVSVVRPDVQLPESRDGAPADPGAPAEFFYPTSVQPYKQPEVVAEAIVAAGLADRVRYAVTLRRGDNAALDAAVDRHGLQDTVDYLGPIPHDDVIARLRRCTAMVFPSLMESFGLPLIEAGGVGARIVVADAPYAHDVLGDYPYADYREPREVDGWAAALRAALDAPPPDPVDWVPSGSTGWAPVLGLLHAEPAQLPVSTDEDAVSVVTVTYSPGRHLDTFLDTLGAATSQHAPVILVDNGSTDGAPERAAERANVELVHSGGNIGFGAAANIGIERATTPWVIVANPDIAWGAGSLDELLAVARQWPRSAAVGPAIITPDGGLYPSARLIPSLGNGIGHALLGPFWASNPWTARYRNEADSPHERRTGWISGSCMLLRRAAVLGIGGFDDRYFMYFEDVDLCDRLQLAGYDVVYAPSAQVTHDQGHAARRDPDRMMAVHHASAYRFLARKYAGPGWAPVRIAIRGGLALRLRVSRLLGRVAEGAPAQRAASELPTERRSDQ